MKGIILAAGYGTRFLPITKTIPKEMLPLGTRPAIDYVVQEYLRGRITRSAHHQLAAEEGAGRLL